MHEIERKFLVTLPLGKIIDRNCQAVKIIEQAYINGDSGDWTIRVRRTQHLDEVQHFITMKRRVGAMRAIEMETRIESDFYEKMLLQSGPVLCKTRYEIKVGEHLWEVDSFRDIDLIIAEIELTDEKEKFAMPPWVGKEVTDKKRYTNKNLVALIRP